MLINKSNVDIFFRGVKKTFEGEFAANQSLNWMDVATLVPSTTKTEDYGWLGDMKDLREWLGPKAVDKLKAHSYSLTNKNFELTQEVSKHDLEDDNYGLYSVMTGAMARSAGRWQDKLVFEALAAGSSELCYDGQNFFDSAHPVGASTQSNINSSGGEAYHYILDTSRAVKPLLFQQRMAPKMYSVADMADFNVFMTGNYYYGVEARGVPGFALWQTAYADNRALDLDNFREVRTLMRGTENDDGHELGIDPTVIVVGRSKEDAALDLFGLSDRFATQGATGIASGSNPVRNAVKVVTVPWLP